MGNIRLFSGKSRKRKRKTGAKTAFIIIIIVLIGLLALALSLGVYVSSLDTVYPNVWVDGKKMSDMSLEEATKALIDAGFESNAANVFATVNFPDGSGFTVSGEDVGFSLNAEEAALAAFEHGRGGSFIENEIAYLRSFFTRTDLNGVSKARFDGTVVRELAAEHTGRFNAALIGSAYTIAHDSITIVVGTGISPADEGSVLELAEATLFQALEEQAHLTVEYTPDPDNSSEVDLDLLYSSISIEAVSAVYDPETFGATQSVTGRSFDMGSAEAMLSRADSGETVVIPLVSIEPEMTTEELESMLFRDLLAERTTNIGGSSNRLNNITISSAAIDGTLLNPGDIFSFNQVVGQRTAKKGYREAGAYVGGILQDEVGGGICQTSSTIYYCVLRADLEVVERRNHPLTISYLPLGHDATVSWGAIDFKFKNSTDFPIRVEVTVNVRDLTVKLFGTKLDDTYIETERVILQTIPSQVIRQEDESIPPGETKVHLPGQTGYIVEVFKSRFDGEGNLLEKWSIGKDTYRAQNRVILVPPGGAEPTPTEAPPEPTPDPTQTDPQPTDPTPTEAPTDPMPTPTEAPTDQTPTDPQQPDPTPTEAPTPDETPWNPDDE